MSDISDTLAPKSDQLDAVDLISGPRIFTVTRVDVRTNAEQPVSVHFAEFPRPWRPGKNQRRVLAFCWGNDSSKWIDHRAELYCDTEVVYAGEKVGGVRIRRLSHIDGTKKAPIIPTRGKGGTYTVDPLPDAAPTAEPTIDARIKQLQSEWRAADADRRAEIQAEVAALKAGL